MRQQFEGKTFYLRGGYLENNLHFNDKGQLDGSSTRASFTLSLVRIDRVHLDKHHIEMEGVRFGLHFLGASPYEEQAVDRVRLTSKKKPLRITIDREEVVAPKKEKPAREEKKKKPAPVAAHASPGQPATAAAGQPGQQQTESASAAASSPGQAAPPVEMGPSSQPPAPAASAPQSGMPAAPPAETRHGATVTTSQANANQTLRQALEAVFASAVDPRMIGTLPPYWQLYYKDVDEKQDYRPADPAVLRQSQVDQKAHLISAFDPPSNEYAQTNGVAGMAMYHVIVEPDGIAGEIAIGRPIGFGLDEAAVDAIRKAKFVPAMKDGKSVPVVLDVVVEFRIYSKLTNRTAASPTGPEAPVLPGPYTANQPKPAAQPPAQPQ